MVLNLLMISLSVSLQSIFNVYTSNMNSVRREPTVRDWGSVVFVGVLMIAEENKTQIIINIYNYCIIYFIND